MDKLQPHLLKTIPFFDPSNPVDSLTAVVECAATAGLDLSGESAVRYIALNCFTLADREKMGWTTACKTLDALRKLVTATWPIAVLRRQWIRERGALFRSGPKDSLYTWASSIRVLSRKIIDTASEEDQIASVLAVCDPAVEMRLAPFPEDCKTWEKFLPLLERLEPTRISSSITASSVESVPTRAVEVLYAGGRGRGYGGFDGARGLSSSRRDIKCFKCGLTGHYANRCKRRSAYVSDDGPVDGVSDTGVFYAVPVGRAIGVFNSWPEAKSSTSGFSGGHCKRFTSKADAEKYIVEYNGGSYSYYATDACTDAINDYDS